MTETIGRPGMGKVPHGQRMKAEAMARKEARGRGPGEATDTAEAVEAVEAVEEDILADEPETEPQE